MCGCRELAQRAGAGAWARALARGGEAGACGGRARRWGGRVRRARATAAAAAAQGPRRARGTLSSPYLSQTQQHHAHTPAKQRPDHTAPIPRVPACLPQPPGVRADAPAPSTHLQRPRRGPPAVAAAAAAAARHPSLPLRAAQRAQRRRPRPRRRHGGQEGERARPGALHRQGRARQARGRPRGCGGGGGAAGGAGRAPPRIRPAAPRGSVACSGRRCCAGASLRVNASSPAPPAGRPTHTHTPPPSVSGILKGYDQLLNVVLDDAVEYLRGARARGRGERRGAAARGRGGGAPAAAGGVGRRRAESSCWRGRRRRHDPARRPPLRPASPSSLPRQTPRTPCA
jgi:hypothetical protein